MRQGWDRGLTFEECLSSLQQQLKFLLSADDLSAPNPKLTYLAVLLTQLLNGCRVGEAVSAVRGWLEDGEVTRAVRVEKRKDNKYRTVIVYDKIPRAALDINSLKVTNVKVYANRLGLNTHTLRYAFITRLLKDGHSPAVIAKITGHKRIDQLITYVQAREAEEILKNFVPGACGSPSADGHTLQAKK